MREVLPGVSYRSSQSTSMSVWSEPMPNASFNYRVTQLQTIGSYLETYIQAWQIKTKLIY